MISFAFNATNYINEPTNFWLANGSIWLKLFVRSARNGVSPEITQFRKDNLERWPLGHAAFQGIEQYEPQDVKYVIKGMWEGLNGISDFAQQELYFLGRGEVDQTQTSKLIAALGPAVMDAYQYLADDVQRLQQGETTKLSQDTASIFDNLCKMPKDELLQGAGKELIYFCTGEAIARGVGLAASTATPKIPKLIDDFFSFENMMESHSLLPGWGQVASPGDLINTHAATKTMSYTPFLEAHKYKLTNIHAEQYSIPFKAMYLGEHNYYKAIFEGGLNIRSKAAESFMGGVYKTYILQEDIILYRVGEQSGQMGSYFTYTKPTSELLARIDSAIRPTWLDGGVSVVDTVFCVKIPAGTEAHIGLAALQGEIFLGGTQQIYIENAKYIPGIKVIESYPL